MLSICDGARTTIIGSISRLKHLGDAGCHINISDRNKRRDEIAIVGVKRGVQRGLPSIPKVVWDIPDGLARTWTISIFEPVAFPRLGVISSLICRRDPWVRRGKKPEKRENMEREKKEERREREKSLIDSPSETHDSSIIFATIPRTEPRASDEAEHDSPSSTTAGDSLLGIILASFRQLSASQQSLRRDRPAVPKHPARPPALVESALFQTSIPAETGEGCN